MPLRGCLLRSSQVHPASSPLPSSQPTSHQLRSTLHRLVMPPNKRIVPVASDHVESVDSRSDRHKTRCSSLQDYCMRWRLFSVAALMTNVCSAVCLGVACIHGQWEIITYNQAAVVNFANQIGFPISTSSHLNYFLLTSNHTLTAVNGSDKAVSFAISKTIINGIFRFCDTVDESAKETLKQEGVIWLTQDCFGYTSSGESQFPYSSPEYIRHSMTRMSQTCLFMSAVCLLTTLITGIISMLFGQLLLCIVVSTIAIAAALYQMFLGVSVLIRMKNELSHLTHSTISATLSQTAIESKAGLSVTCIWAASVLSLVTGLLWIAVYRWLSGHVKLLESRDNNVAYSRYNYCCSHVM